jgi:hypothetical protein
VEGCRPLRTRVQVHAVMGSRYMSEGHLGRCGLVAAIGEDSHNSYCRFSNTFIIILDGGTWRCPGMLRATFCFGLHQMFVLIEVA